MDVDALEKGTLEQQQLLIEMAAKVSRIEKRRAALLDTAQEDYAASTKTVHDAAEFLRTFNGARKVADNEIRRTTDWLMEKLLGANPDEIAMVIGDYLFGENGLLTSEDGRVGALGLEVHPETGEMRMRGSNGETLDLDDMPTEVLEAMLKLARVPGMVEGQGMVAGHSDNFDQGITRLEGVIAERKATEGGAASGLGNIEGIGSFEDMPVAEPVRQMRDFDGEVE